MSDPKIVQTGFIPNWAKLLAAILVGGGGSIGGGSLPIHFNAEKAYNIVVEEYPGADVETRSWAPHSHKVHEGGAVIFVRTSPIDGEIVDMW